jgi:hypothetical protein
MTFAKTTLLQAVRWLVVMMTSLLVLQGNVFAVRTVKVESSCASSCEQRCPCCVSKPTPQPSAPIAPASSARVVIEKDFQFVPLLAQLLTPALKPSVAFTAGDFSASLRSLAPLYQRHCIYLI